jgi:hypothetical protein
MWYDPGSVLASVSGVYHGGVSYLSLEVLIDPTVGHTRVYVDGAAVPELSLDNIDTQPFTTGFWDGFWCGSTGWTKICDLLVADGTDPSGAGHDLHEIWMDARVDYVPGDGNGYSSQFVGSDADSVDNHELIKETTPDDDTTYVESADPAIDSYTHGPVPAGATILGACVFARARKTDAGVAVMRVGLRSGSTNGMSDAQALAINYTDLYACIGHDPADGAFTKSSIDAMELVLEKT